jgi:uncharacterized membrane protein YhaH (DUF805 family)
MKSIYFFGNLDGRIGRKTFWIASIAVGAIVSVVATVAAAITKEFVNEAASRTAVDIVVFVFLFLFPQFVIAVKRAHDRNISTWIVSAWLVLLATTDALDFLAGCRRGSI